MHSSSTELADASQLTDDELFGALWRDGELDWLLDSNQQETHAHYRAWEQTVIDGCEPEGDWSKIYVRDASRRYGKDFICLVERVEDCLRKPNGLYTYATAFQKDITDILIPMLRVITAQCPADIKPEFRQSKQGESMGFYFPNGSVIKLVGIDKNPDGLRGRASDGFTIGEAGFVDHLQDAVLSIIYPQLQGRPWATIVLQSTPSDVPGHPYDDVFMPEAQKRGAYILRTIDDNPRLSNAEREKFIKAAGGRDADRCKREYFCIRARNQTRTVVPEFTAAANQALWDSLPPRPQYADAYVGMDPGIRDMCGIVWGYYDFENARVVIERAWAKRNANTSEVADVLKKTEADLWGGEKPLTAWNGQRFTSNPFLRVSDIDLRLIGDLRTEHGVAVAPAAKDDKEAALHAVRNGILRGKIVIDPVGASELVQHIEKAIWNKSRTDYERSEVFGHYDLLDALVYLYRHVLRNRNPFPPANLGAGQTMFTPKSMQARERMRAHGIEGVVFGKDARKGVRP